MEKRIQRIVCISVVLLCVCTLVEVISSIYKPPLTEWDKKNIETARAEVQEILNADPDSFPEATYAFDNETAVADAEKVDVGKVYDSFPGLYSSVIGKEVNDETLKEAGLLIRYHRGRYYAINYTTEGKLLIFLFAENESGEPWRAETHYLVTPGCGLADAKQFFSVVRPGVSRQKIDGSFPATEIYPSNNLSAALYLLDDMTAVDIGYHYEGDPDTATKKDVTVPSSGEICFIVLGKYSILPYLLPQDLALIS